MSERSPLSASPGTNRAKWLILAIFVVSCGLILPLSWQAIQAEQRQSALMKSLKKSLDEIEKTLRNPRCEPKKLAPAFAKLASQTRAIDATFPRLSLPASEFAQFSHALSVDSARFAANSQRSSCQSQEPALSEIKNRCGACHKTFGRGPAPISPRAQHHQANPARLDQRQPPP
jgi:cytochrome c556